MICILENTLIWFVQMAYGSESWCCLFLNRRHWQNYFFYITNVQMIAAIIARRLDVKYIYIYCAFVVKLNKKHKTLRYFQISWIFLAFTKKFTHAPGAFNTTNWQFTCDKDYERRNLLVTHKHILKVFRTFNCKWLNWSSLYTKRYL